MKQILRYIKTLPLVESIYREYRDVKNREKRKTYGSENHDKTFYVIGLPDMSCGLWWIINKVVMHIAYAEDHGYIPVVDMLHYHTQYHDIKDKNKVNVWEKYFEQPANLNLIDISSSKNIVLSCKKDTPDERYLMGNTDFYEDSERYRYFKRIFKQYIRFTKETESKLENIRKSIVPEGAKTLGVLCRGTDYLLKKPKDHPIQPEPQQVIRDAEEIMKDRGCEYIFLATEDQDILDMFKLHFGAKLKYIEQARVSHDQMKNVNRLMSVSSKISKNKYLMGIEYLSATYVLSKCECFIGGRCGGTKGVLLMNDVFEYKYIYNLGFYE